VLTAFDSAASAFAGLVLVKAVAYIAVSMVLVLVRFGGELVRYNLPVRMLLLSYQLW
jgi:hypothetical protein